MVATRWPPQQNFAERGIAVGLRALELARILGPARPPRAARAHRAAAASAQPRRRRRTAARAGRTFAAAQKRSRPARQPKAGRTDLFDLEPSDEQQMLQDSVRDFAIAQAAPARRTPTPPAPPRPSCSAQANELGLTMVGVPEELGGAVEQRSAVTSALISEALAQGDMGIAVACLAPAGVADGDRPVGRRRAAGHLPSRVRRRQAARRGARDPRAARRCSTRSRCRQRPASRAAACARRRQVAGPPG